MTTVPHAHDSWRKSSRSSAQQTCVEVRRTLNAMRDSKDPAGPMLQADLGPLVAAVKSGRLDR